MYSCLKSYGCSFSEENAACVFLCIKTVHCHCHHHGLSFSYNSENYHVNVYATKYSLQFLYEINYIIRVIISEESISRAFNMTVTRKWSGDDVYPINNSALIPLIQTYVLIKMSFHFLYTMPIISPPPLSPKTFTRALPFYIDWGAFIVQK